MSKAQKAAVEKMKPSAYKSMMLGKLGMTKSSPEKKMRLYFASIKDPVERKKQVNKWLLSQRQRLKEKAEKS